MTAPISTTSAPHYQWGAGCEGWHLVRAPELSVIQERMPPGTAEIRHRHLRARQLFFVLKGELVLEADGVHHTVGTGVGIEITPGVYHQVLNSSLCDADFLVISQPPSHGDRDDGPAA